MATTSPSKATFIKSVMAEMNTRRFNKMSAASRLANVMQCIQTIVRYEVVTAHVGMIAYAVAWSVQSARLNMEPEKALMAMDTRQLVGLVYDLSKACQVQIDVTNHLNEMYAPKLVEA